MIKTLCSVIFSYSLAIFALLVFPVQSANCEPIIIDAVVATIDGEPITFSEVTELMTAPRPATVEAAKSDAVFKSVLENLISEKLLELEANSKRINVTENEVTTYVNSVAERNGLSTEDFAIALEKEGQTLETFQRSVRVEILRTKLASSLMQDGVAIPESEINEHLGSVSDSESEPQKQVKLRQILITNENRSTSEVEDRCKDVYYRLKEGADFARVATQYSDSPDAKDGGALEVIATKDLNPIIFDAILTLDDGEYSEPITTAAGCQIFLLEGHFDSESQADSENLRAEVRKQLERQKMEEKFQTYFSTEVYKNHTIERKV